MLKDILLGRNEENIFYSSILDRDLRSTYLETLYRVSRWLGGVMMICLLLVPLSIFVAPDITRWFLAFAICFLVIREGIESKIRLLRVVNLLQRSTADKK